MAGATLPNFSRLHLGQNRPESIGSFKQPRHWEMDSRGEQPHVSRDDEFQRPRHWVMDSRGEQQLKQNPSPDDEHIRDALSDTTYLMASVKWISDHKESELLVSVQSCTKILRTIGQRARLYYAYFNQIFKVDGPKRGPHFPIDQVDLLKTLLDLLETNRSLLSSPTVTMSPEIEGEMNALNEELLMFLCLGIMIPPEGRVSNIPEVNKRAWQYIESYGNHGRKGGDAIRDILISFLASMSELDDFDAWMQSNEEWTGVSAQGWRLLVHERVAEKSRDYSFAIIKVAESVVARARTNIGGEPSLPYEEQKRSLRSFSATNNGGPASESEAKRLKATAAPVILSHEEWRRHYSDLREEKRRKSELERKSEWEAKNAAPVILSEEERRRRHAQVWGAGGKEDYDLDELARLDREAKNKRGSHAAALAKYEEDQRKSEREAKNNGGPVLSEEERRRRHAQVWGGTKQDNYDWDEYARQQNRLNRATKPSSDESLAHIHPSLAEVKR